MAWQPGGAAFGSAGRPIGGPTSTQDSRKATLRARLSAAVESMVWMFQRSEGVGWLIALLVNVVTVGWLGVAIWSALFCIAILLETMAEPVQSVD